jgi:hypothetical protein
MNREDVIRIAKEVWGDDSGKPWHESALVHLEAFAKLVAAAEREACAEMCEVKFDFCGDELLVADAIRARGQG